MKPKKVRREAKTWRGWVWRFNDSGKERNFYEGQQGGGPRALPGIYETRAEAERGQNPNDGCAVRVEIREVL